MFMKNLEIILKTLKTIKNIQTKVRMLQQF